MRCARGGERRQPRSHLRRAAARDARPLRCAHTRVSSRQITTNKPEEINAALDSGVDINIRGPSGYTPLFESVLKHRVHSVELLMKRGADIRLRNEQGFDALDAAAFGGCAMCAAKLMKAGLDPRTVRHDGFNVLHRAMCERAPQPESPT